MKTACVNLQMCAGLEAGIEGETNAVGQSRVDRVLARRVEEEGETDERQRSQKRREQRWPPVCII